MARTSYLGSNVCLISGFPFESYGYVPKQEDLDLLETLFVKVNQNNKFKHLLAITANKFQPKAREILKNDGFSEVITFLSSHNMKNETLTIWHKVKEGKFKASNLAIETTDYNCSVSFNNEADDRRCSIVVKDPNNNDFVKIENAPIWIKIDKEFIVK